MLGNDPGYETVETNAANSRKPNSDYDPNYEVLRPMDADETSDHYAKVWDKETSKLDANDGYSSIKAPKKIVLESDEEVPGYCTIANDTQAGYSSINKTNSGQAKGSAEHHDYASISESTKRNYFKTNTGIIADEDVYSSIPSETSVAAMGSLAVRDLPSSSSAVTSPMSNIMQISGYSTVSETKTITSPSSSEGGNSSDTQVEYNRVRSNNDLSQMTQSTYESLTGSESDPNYESVRYLNVRDRENPYERLHNEKGSSPEPGKGKRNGGSTSASDKNSSSSSILTNNDSSDVGDYFQV